jgi:biopolymer transport protein ExbB/TolQ
MNELPRRIAELLESGGFAVMVPLFACCAWLWIVLLERMSSMGAPWMWLVPSFRRKLAEERKALLEALESYVERPTRKGREAVVTICRARPGPFSLFVRRALGGGLRDPQGPSRRALEIRLLEASLAGEHEAERGLTLVSSLTRAALLLGLLGTVTGLEVMFREMAHSGPGDLEFWRTGLSTALVSAEAGLVVALSGLAGRGWLSSRARALADEIRSSGIRLRQVACGSSPEVLS